MHLKSSVQFLGIYSKEVKIYTKIKVLGCLLQCFFLNTSEKLDIS